MSLLASFLLPHPPLLHEKVGKGQEKEIAETQKAFQYVARKIKDLKPETIVFMSPHTVMYSDYFHISPGQLAYGDFSSFGVKDPETKYSVIYDQLFAMALTKDSQLAGIHAGPEGEQNSGLDHGILVPLSEILKEYNDFEVVRMGMSGYPPITHYLMGMIIAKTAKILKRRTVFIASGDLSHRLKKDGPYGFVEEGPIFDREIGRILDEGDFASLLKMDPARIEKAGECGYRSIVTLAGTLNGLDAESRVISYEGTFGVGYMVAEFYPGPPNEKRDFYSSFMNQEEKRMEEVKEGEDPYVALARVALEERVKEGRKIKLEDLKMAGNLKFDLPEDISSKSSGVFVTLHMYNELRGCIGTTEGREPSLGEEIISNAISAGLRDPRFEPLTEEELPFLEYSVDILYPAEPIQSLEELDPKIYGVIVEKGHRRGLLLPDIEGVDTASDQVDIALRKAGLSKRENFNMLRFKVERHK